PSKRGLGAAQPQPVAPISEAPETVSIDRWLQGLSQPYPYRVGLKAAYDPAFVWNTLTPPPPPATTADRWFQPLSQPYPAKRGLAAADQLTAVAPVSEAPETVTVDRWLQGLSTPSRVGRVVPDAGTTIPPQQAPQGWDAPLSEPVRRRATVPGSWTAPPVVGSAPTPEGWLTGSWTVPQWPSGRHPSRTIA